MPFPSYQNVYLPLRSAAQLKAISHDPQHVVIVPLGAIEQHGPHLPVGTDSLIGEILIEGMTERLGPDFPLVVSPALTFTKSNEHTGFPGTLFVKKEILFTLVEEIVNTLIQLGFSRIAFLNTHGGNTAWLRTFIREQLSRTGQRLHLLNPVPELDQDPREARYGIHAGEYETSLLYSVVPELCKPGRADCQWIDRNLNHPDLQPEFSPVTFAWAASDLSPTGTMGDATRATAEKGKQWISKAVDSLITQLKELPA